MTSFEKNIVILYNTAGILCTMCSVSVPIILFPVLKDFSTMELCFIGLIYIIELSFSIQWVYYTIKDLVKKRNINDKK